MFAEGVLKETSKVGDAKLVGGGLQGSGRGSPTPVFPGRGIPGRGFPGQGFHGQGFPGQGFPGQFRCINGCCYGNARGCLACC